MVTETGKVVVGLSGVLGAGGVGALGAGGGVGGNIIGTSPWVVSGGAIDAGWFRVLTSTVGPIGAGDWAGSGANGATTNAGFETVAFFTGSALNFGGAGAI